MVKKSLFGILSFASILVSPGINADEASKIAAATDEAARTTPIVEEVAENQHNFTIAVEGAYRMDEYQWSINAAGVDPLSELDYSDIESIYTMVKAKFKIGKSFYVLPRFGYGEILEGSSTDSDYDVSGRRGLSTRFKTDIEGDVWEAGVDFAWKGKCKFTGLPLMPFIGFAMHRLNLELRDGRIDFSRIDGLEEGRFGGLASEDDAYWFGPRLGLATRIPVGSRVGLSLKGYVAWYEYRTDNYWNLRRLSFENEAQGIGYGGKAALDFALNSESTYKLYLFASYDGFTQVGDGEQNDRGFDIDLDNIEWASFRAGLGVKIKF